jgi:hypothetical protein
MHSREASIHLAVAGFIRAQYPDIIFRTDFAAGIKMTMGQAVKHRNLQAGRAYPDLFIAKPMDIGRHILAHGLYLELKQEGIKLKRVKDATKVLKGEHRLRVAGDWWDKHTEEQAAVLEQLDSLGYRATFAVGFDEAVRIIKQYLGGTNDHENNNQPF